jgi:hypothetical protein
MRIKFTLLVTTLCIQIFGVQNNISNDNKLKINDLDIYFLKDIHEIGVFENSTYNIYPIQPDTCNNMVDSLQSFIYGFRYEFVKTNIKVTVNDYFHYVLRNVSIKINTIKGLDSLNNICKKVLNLSNVRYINITDKKPNGDIFTIDGNVFYNMYVLDSCCKIRYNYNHEYNVNIEKGDIIDIQYFVESPSLVNGNNSYSFLFYSSIFTLIQKSIFIIPKSFYYKYKCYNNLKEPIQRSNNQNISFEFEMDSVFFDESDMSNTCFTEVFPYLDFSSSLDRISSKKELFSENDFISIVNTEPKSDMFNDIRFLINKKLEGYNITDKYYKFYFLYDKIYTEEKVTKPLAGHELSIINPINYRFLHFYSKLLKYLKIDFYLCVGMDKYVGKLNPDLSNLNNYTDCLLMFYTNDSNKIFLFPHNSNAKYYINEYPSYLNGTKIIAFKQKPKLENSKQTINSNDNIDQQFDIKVLELKNGDEHSNYLIKKDVINISPTNDSIYYTSNVESGGYESNIQRNIFDSQFVFTKDQSRINNNCKINKYETIAREKTFPFRFHYKCSGSYKIPLYQCIDDSTLELSLKTILLNSTLECKKGRTLSFIVPYKYTVSQNSTLVFPYSITLLEGKNITDSIKNSIGSFKFNLEFKDNRIRVNTDYTIYKDYINNDELDGLINLNSEVNSILFRKVLFRIKRK